MDRLRSVVFRAYEHELAIETLHERVHGRSLFSTQVTFLPIYFGE